MLDLNTAFQIFIESYLITARQRQVGRRKELGPVVSIRYEFDWQGNRVVGDNFFLTSDDYAASIAAIRAYRPHREHQIFVIERSSAVKPRLEALGCRYTTPDYLMMRPLTVEDTYLLPAYPVQRARTLDDVTTLNEVKDGPRIWAEDVFDRRFRHYYCRFGTQPAALGRTMRREDHLTWESNVFTAVAYRRRKLGTALMQQILKDNARAGYQASLLLSTAVGHPLYQHLGYQDLATIGHFQLSA